MKKTAIPPTVMNAPSTSRQVSFSPKKSTDGKRIKTGTVAIKVDAMPAEVC